MKIDQILKEDAEPIDREFALVKKLGRLGERVVQNPRLWDRYDQAIDNNDTDWVIGLIQDGTGATANEITKLADLFGEIGGGLGRIIDFAWAVKEGTWNKDFMDPYRAHRSQDMAEGMLGSLFGKKDDQDQPKGPELVIYVKHADGSKTYANVKDAQHLADLQKKYRDEKPQVLDSSRQDVLDWLQSRGVSLSKFWPGAEVTVGNRSLAEFAPSGDDGSDGFDDETLKRMAAQWWQGDEDPRVEQALAAAGWEIGQDEGYDNGGVFVVQADDVNGKSYMSWPAEELESLNEFAPADGGGGAGGGGRRTGGDGDDDSGEDPYKYPQPEHYSRSIDFFGRFEADHFDDEVFDDATGEFRGYWDDQEGRDQIAYFKFDNPKRTGDDDPGMGWYYEPQNESVAEGPDDSDDYYSLPQPYGDREEEFPMAQDTGFDVDDEAEDNPYGYKVGQTVKLDNGQQGRVIDIFDDSIEVLLVGGRTVTVDFRDAQVIGEQGVAEGSGNIGSAIKSLYQKIYRAGDDEIDYFYHASPIFAQYWDEYEGDLDSIIAEVDPSELEVIKAELESYVDDANLAEGFVSYNQTLRAVSTENEQQLEQALKELVEAVATTQAAAPATTQQPAAAAPATTQPATPAKPAVDPVQQKADEMEQKLLDRMGARFGLPAGSSMEQVAAAQQAYLDKNDPKAAAQYKQNMANIDAGNTAANKPVELAPKPAAPATAPAQQPAATGPTKDADFNAGLAAQKAGASPVEIMLAQPSIAGNQSLLDAIAPSLGLPAGSTADQLKAAAKQKYGGAKQPAPAAAPAAPVAEGKAKEKEADYGPDYQDMVARVKKLAGLGPLKTVWDPQKRVYKNVPVAVQPKK